jgi:hypothetical protein
MFNPVPGNDEQKTQFSEKPLPTFKPSGQSPDVPEGESLFDHVLDCLDRGSSKSEVRKQLIAMGYSATDAEACVEEVAEWRQQNGGNLNISKYPPAPGIANPGAAGGGFNTNMWVGALICVVGIVITLGTCMAANERGGSVTIAWGAIVFGAIQFFRGLSQQNESQ